MEMKIMKKRIVGTFLLSFIAASQSYAAAPERPVKKVNNGVTLQMYSVEITDKRFNKNYLNKAISGAIKTTIPLDHSNMHGFINTSHENMKLVSKEVIREILYYSSNVTPLISEQQAGFSATPLPFKFQQKDGKSFYSVNVSPKFDGVKNVDMTLDIKAIHKEKRIGSALSFKRVVRTDNGSTLWFITDLVKEKGKYRCYAIGLTPMIVIIHGGYRTAHDLIE